MIPNTDYGETITSGQMETGAATIELTPEMFTLLSSGMYTDKILAAIREPICNARDAQVESEDGVPLEMHLPTRLEPFFHIRDFGMGLSERQVVGYTDEDGTHVPGLYLRYGKSTKRDSNLQIGGFGIGCKAPLAYSDSFIVESYQQGIVKTYTIYKENGIPNVAKLNEKATVEQDGLKVKIAVVNSDINTFVQKAAEFLRFFDYPVNVTGQSITTTVKYVLKTTLYDTVECGYGDAGHIKAIMGGVVYNVSDSYREDLEQITKNNMLIMKFNIGDLSVAGSRESLSEDKDTLSKLDAAVAKIKSEFYAVMRAEVEDPKHSPYEAMAILKKFDLLNRRDWRSNKVTLKAAAKGFTIGGEDAQDVLDKFQDTSVRTIDTRAGRSDAKFPLDSFEEVPVVLEVDRGSGYLKVARKLSNSGPIISPRTTPERQRVVLALDTGDLEELQEYFGKDKLTVEKVSVKYAEYFPKGAASSKIKVAASGLFTTTRADVKELDATQEGYYIPFERYNCIMQGLPSGYHEFSVINKVVKALIAAGRLKKEEVFYSRKAGMRAIKKTKLKELTWSDILVLAIKAYTAQDYKEYVYLNGQKTGNPATNKHQKLAPLWEKVKHNYPVWNSPRKVIPTKGVTFLTDSKLVLLLEKSYETDLLVLTKKYEVETKQFNEDFTMLGAFNYWSLKDNMVDDIIAFCEWKQAKTTLATKVAA
jgi:hypothetical protein